MNGCNGIDHVLSRRHFLAGTSAGMLGFHGMLSPANADTLRREEKRALVIFLSGGVSQLETWDPKPDAPANIRGPLGSIATKIPGTRICQYLPRLAQRADRYAILRFRRLTRLRMYGLSSP